MAKKIVICDTDVIIDCWNRNSPRHNSTKDQLETSIQLDNVMLSAITKMELIIGSGNKEELNKINKKINRFDIALIDENITLLAIELLQLHKLSHGLVLPDAIIAATSLILEIELFTYNVKDYKFIDGLALYEM